MAVRPFVYKKRIREKLMLKIRLKRMGANKKPFYRIVVADSRAPRDGRFIEEIGYYNPVSEPKQIKINDEKSSLKAFNAVKDYLDEKKIAYSVSNR